MEVKYRGVWYTDGDKIEFDNIYQGGRPPVREVGILKFGEYDDGEGYDVFTHLGFYVVSKNFAHTTLPDIINCLNGKKVENV